MSVKIIKPGMFATIQDQGRIGFRSSGIGTGGAMDLFAAAVANFLTGNKASDPVIEMHFPAPELLFEQDAIIALAGADFGACIDQTPAAVWQPMFIKKGQQLFFKKFTHGARAYLSVYGGIQADKWLNSFSTNVKAKTGGFNGRHLLKEDKLVLNASPSIQTFENFPGIVDLVTSHYEPAGIVRCIAGPEWDSLTATSKTVFFKSSFSVTGQSDRMGYRLKGDALMADNNNQLVSSAVDRGTVQLLPNGQLIVLMADHQTTGGYPRIANVISADLPKLAQCPIHREFQFKQVAIETAEDALLSLYQTLEAVKKSCDQYYAAHRHQL